MKIHEYPERIEDAALALHEISEQLQSVREGLGWIECQVKADVLMARDEAAGKALYSNDTARECAASKLLSEREGYNDLKASERRTEAVKAERSARLERLRKEFEIALLDYEAERLGRRQAA
jgi:hypothetical protein